MPIRYTICHVFLCELWPIGIFAIDQSYFNPDFVTNLSSETNEKEKPTLAFQCVRWKVWYHVCVHVKLVNWIYMLYSFITSIPLLMRPSFCIRPFVSRCHWKLVIIWGLQWPSLRRQDYVTRSSATIRHWKRACSLASLMLLHALIISHAYNHCNLRWLLCLPPH